ncbi:hypothetical protein [Brachyspira intermedia]|uniref:phage tail protein n=1 Tax=Brachyspira intermedia TaxID=84377 RepID=UPI0030045BAE
MGEVYSVGFDLSALEKALKMSEKIKTNLSGFQELSNKNTQNNSSDFSKNIIDSNKQLKEQNKLLGGSLQKLNLIRLVSSKIKWGALGAIGLAGTGITAGIASMNGTLAANTRAKNTGLTFGESNALNFAGKMTGLGEDTLISAIEGLTTSMEDFDKWGNFASLGLNASDLQNKNPTEALFEVLKSMKELKEKGYENTHIKKIIDDIGIPFDNFRFILEEGTGEIQKYFKEGMGMFGGKDGKSLMEGERALIRFTTILKDVSQNIGGKIAPALTTGLKLITPYVYQLADGFTWLLGKVFTKKNLDMMSGFFNSIGKIGSDLVSKGINLFDGGKDLFSQMFKGFSIDTEGWANVFKELSKGFLDGMSSLWDTLKPNLIAIGQSLVDVWKTIEPDLLTLLEFWKTNILPPLQSIFGSAVNILGKTIKKIIDDFKWFYNLIRPIFKPLGELFSSFYNTVSKIFGNLDKESDEGGTIEMLISGFAGLLSPISAFKTVIELAELAVDTFKTKITETWQSIKDSFADIWKHVKIGFYTAVTAIVDLLRKIPGVEISGWRFENTKAGLYHRQKNGNLMNVTLDTIDDINDGVITKEGKIIKTDPQDYIFAMKRPQDLAAAGASQSGGYTVNIYNPVVKDDKDIRQLKNELERLIRSFNSKR